MAVQMQHVLRELQITIPFDPIPAARPRVISRAGKTWSFMPERTMNAEETIALLVRNEWRLKIPIDGPIVLDIHAHISRPKSYPTDNHPHMVRKDVDNYAKLIMDALTKAKVWYDDCQIVELGVVKSFVIPPAKPHWRVALSRITR